MKTIETSGKNVEEAIRAGLKELGCDISEVTSEVLDHGSPGLFGMFGRLARVRLTVKEQTPDFDIEMPVLSINPQTETDKKAARRDKPAREPKAEKPAPVKPVEKSAPAKPEAPAVVTEEVPAPAAKDAAVAEAPVKPRRERAPRREKAPRVKAEPVANVEPIQNEAPAEAPAPAPELPPLDVEKLGEDGKKAYDFLSNVTRMMGVNVEIRMLEEENHLTVEMTGDTLGVLIGRRGETMDALQYLTSLTVNKDKNDYTRVSLDVEHYRAKREATLRNLALRMANRARKSGRRVVLEPMNPYERRVLHSALQNNPYVQTHSEGEEPYRRVIITLK